MRNSQASLYGAFGVAALALAIGFAMGGGAVLDGFAGIACAAALAVGVIAHRPTARTAWGLLVVSRLFGAIADFSGGISHFGTFGAVGVIYLLATVTTLAGIALLAVRGVDLRDTTALLDSAIVAMAAGIAMWVVFLDDGVSGPAVHPAAVLGVSVECLVAVCLLARLAVEPGRISVAFKLMVGAVLSFLVAAGALSTHSGAGSLTEAARLLAFGLLGAAALHPSMAALVARRPDRSDRSAASRRRVVGLGIALTTVPVCVLVQDLWRNGEHVAAIAAAGAIVACVTTARALTLVHQLDRLRARTEGSERKFRLIFEGAPVGISIGRDGMMSETNAAAQAMLGYTGDELAALHFSQITHPEDVAAEAQQRLDDGRSTHVGMDKRYIRRDGSLVETRASVALDLVDGLGVAIIEDVSDRRRLEEQLLQSRKMEAVGKLAGGVAHDFNNLMTAVLGYSEMLIGELEGKSQDRARAIHESASRASDLTRQLLAFSRQQMLQTSNGDLRDVVAAVAPKLRDTLGDAIELQVEVTSAPVPVHADLEQLEQVVLNLAANARDAMPQGGQLTIDVRSTGGKAILAVGDTGVGIPEELRPRVFEPFFTTKRFGEAAGLGLSTVDGIVAQSGGSVDVADAVGGGTVFTVRLPLAA
jgi:PAS domain S-box-containing protein